ncbi:MFS transporter [Bacillus sp. FJAT-45350]|uniref:MFS transporter n=1 Tax=Bacillus sp. FJAT-45350 TaxID=2011014 RepID=UPI000BB7BCB8|nr:MFS transporter [Bacillus sp. FJAT-45350]
MSVKGTRWLITLNLGLLPLLMVLGNSMLIPILPNIQTEMGLNTIEGGMILTVFAIPAALIIPFVGILADRIGRRIIVLVSLIFIIIGCLLSAIASTYVPGQTGFSILLFGRLLQGLGAGGTAPLAMILAGDLFEGIERSSTLGILEVFNGIGKVISPIIGALAAIWFWESSFYFYAVVSFVSFVGIVLFIKDKEGTKSSISFSLYMKKVSSVMLEKYKWIIPIFISSGVGLFLLFGMLFFLSFELEVMHQISGVTKSLLLALPLAFLTLFSYIAGKNIGTNVNQIKRYMIIGLLLVFVSFCLLLFFHGLGSLLIYSTMLATGLGLFLPASSTAITSSVSKEERGTVVSLYSMVRFLGVAFGPITFSMWMANVQEMFYLSILSIGVPIVILMMSWTCIPIMKYCPQK